MHQGNKTATARYLGISAAPLFQTKAYIDQD